MPKPHVPPSAQFARTSFVEITLFTIMVAAIGTVAFVVMGEFGWLTSCFLGGGIGLLAGIVLAILLRQPRSAPADKPVGRAPRASGGEEGHAVPAKGDPAEPAATLQSRGLGSIPDAGGVGRPATPEARSPLDPAEIPIEGAGGPTPATTTAEAKVTPSDAPASAPAEPSGGTRARVSDVDTRGDDTRSDVTQGPVVTTTAEPADGGAESDAAGGDAAKSDAAGGDDAGGAVAYEPSEAPAAPIVKPATARGAPETVASEHEGPEPEKPALLDAPREGGPDDLTRIRGVGPALESMLHEMGVYHFEQIASWGPAEVAWVDENLHDFKGRVSRDDWVGQAKDLTARDAADDAGG